MYSYKKQFPESKPLRIRMPDGSTKTGSITEEDLSAAGYVNVGKPPTANYDEKVVWKDGDWLVEKHTEEDIRNLWSQIRQTRDQKIAEMEWRYNRFYRHERLGLPQIDTIEELDICVQALADITKSESPYHISWPVLGSKKWP